MSAKKKSGNDKWKIVIVEDSPTQAEQLKYILETHGYQVVAASSGKEALALLRSDKPNLVISDIVMPEMDGYELCKQIKTDEKLKDIPVILLTALSDPTDVIKGLECGADNFLTKPYDERVLFSRIEYLRLNWRLPENKQVQMGVEITFSRQKYFITSDRLQILNLLLSTYETAVSKSKELEQAHGELRRLNEQLEQRVKARTAELAKVNEELKLEITERKKMGEERERLIGQLEAIIKELEAFAYTISHDLRGPLVTIEGFVRMLRSDLEKKETERVEEDIRSIETGISKMRQLLKGILAYARVGRVVEPTKNVPFKEIIKESLEQLAEQIRSSKASISLAETFPTVYMDRMRMVQVLNNLIQNSIQYRDKNRRLTIEIGHRVSGCEVVFFVRDNGIGIEPDELEKVFELFYRGEKESQGMGAGLAIARRIVDAHGGRIWVQAQQEKGTTMCFALSQQSSTNKGDNNGGDTDSSS